MLYLGSFFYSFRKEKIVKKKYLFEMEELLKDWDYEANKGVDIREVSFGSITKYVWKCHVCGHVWEATMNNRCGKGTGCPCCSNRVVVKGKNDLSTTDPGLLAEWNYGRNI